MAIQDLLSDIHTRLKEFKPVDIKRLVQSNGKTREGDKEFILEEPSPTNSRLQGIITNPNLEIRSIGNQNITGEMYYDLIADGEQVRVKVICQKLKEEKKI